MTFIRLTITLLFNYAVADFGCLCNYAVETKVYSAKDTNSKAIGYLYEFDCKHKLTLGGDTSSAFVAIEFEHKLGFVEKTDTAQIQICPGEPPLADKLYTTTTPATETTTTTTNITTVSTKQRTTTPTFTTTTPYTTTTTDDNTSTEDTKKTKSFSVMTEPSSSSLTTWTQRKSTTSDITHPSHFSVSTSLASLTKSTSFVTSQPFSHETISTNVLTNTVSNTTLSTVHNSSDNTTPSSTLGGLPVIAGPFTYLGVGYNTLYAYPSTKQDGIDPGLKPHRRIFTLNLTTNSTNKAQEAEYTIYPVCNITHSSEFLYDGGSYQRNLLNYLSVPSHGKASDKIQGEAFTFNTQFLTLRNELESRNKDNTVRVYKDDYSPCEIGKAQYRDNMVNNSDVKITKEFAKDVCQLPSNFDLSTYIAFIDRWGTTVVLSVKTGTFTTKRYKTSGYNLLTKLNGNDKVYLTGPYQGYPTSVTFNASALSSISGVTIGIPVNTWSVNRSTPVPLKLEVVPLPSALEEKYWIEVTNSKMYTDVCPQPIDTNILHNIAVNIDKALGQYADYKTPDQSPAHQPLNDVPIQIPLTWPYGTYGLMQAASGCPGSGVNWLKGSRKQDTESVISGNTESPDIRQFLAGFQTGSIYWDDNNAIFSNKNSVSGTLPDGTFDQNTLIHYCCRKDRSPTNNIPLPRDMPFVLLRYGKYCQSVYGMETRELYIRWDDEDLFNKDSASGAHPADDGGTWNHMLYFCHYKAKQTGISPSMVG